ncbi:MAG: extracellular solute-binding protein [Spirochaetales bacterium]|nr:extracellular solute-binding protein [Spirochaetales bacterium]
MKIRLGFLFLLLITGALVFAGGTQEEAQVPKTVTVDYATYRVGMHVSAPAEGQVLAEFITNNKDTITLRIEELPSDDAYTNKMKTLAASKSLPHVIDSKNGLRELAVKNGQAVNLIPILNADPEWKAVVGQGAIDFNTGSDGKCYSLATGKWTLGYFYNKEMFDAVGIRPAKNWDEFMTNCAALKAGGYTPLAMMTGENSWTTNLFLAAMVGSSNAAGNAFMNYHYPDNYETPEMIKALTMMKTLLKDYSTGDSLGANYANAANNFCQEQAAMIANGPWMIPDFSNPEKTNPGFDRKVAVAMFPNNSAVSLYDVGYSLCTAGESKEVQDAAIIFLKHMTSLRAQEIYLTKANMLPASPLLVISDEFRKDNVLLSQLIEKSGKTDLQYQTFDQTAYASVVDAFGVYYPEMVFDSITPAEMAKKLTEAALKNK